MALATLHHSTTVRADLLILNDDSTVACRVTEETPVHLRVVFGTAAKRRESTLPHERIAARLQTIDEVAFLESCDDAAVAARWAASYYRAGFETLARRCIGRAIALAPEAEKTPLRAGRVTALVQDAPADDFTRFWNFVIMRERTAKATSDATALVAVAEFARKGGYPAETAQLLRRAWSVNPWEREVARKAQDWGVRLEGQFGIDLTVSQYETLLDETILDEGRAVSALPDQEFLLMPIRYSTDSVPRFEAAAASTTDREEGRPAEDEAAAGRARSLGRNAFRGPVMRGFYGLRQFTFQGADVHITKQDDRPVFERASFSREQQRPLMIELRNLTAPRAPQTDGDGRTGGDGGTPRNRPPRSAAGRNVPTMEKASGCAGLWTEIPRGLKVLRVTWVDGLEESLDLDFVRQARSVHLDEVRKSLPAVVDDVAGKKKPRKKGSPWSTSPLLADMLKAVESASPAMTALAISRLRSIRQELCGLEGEDTEADRRRWAEAVDSIVLRSALRDEEQVRVAVWKYFCDYPLRGQMLPSALAVRTLARSDTDLAAAWVRIIGCGLGHESGGHWWRGVVAPSQETVQGKPRRDAPAGGGTGPVTDPDADRRTQSRFAAARLLEGILQVEDPIICTEAADLITSLPIGVTDWQFLRTASGPAQRETLARLERIKDGRSAALLMQALILSARPEIAQDLVQALMSRGLHARDADAALLDQWSAFETADRRVAFLNVLRGLHMGDHVYTARFAGVINEAIAAGGEERAAAWQLAAAQLRHRRENVSIGLLKRAEHGTGSVLQRLGGGLGPREGGSRLGPASRYDRTAPHYHGPFPMFIDSASLDPLVQWAVQAVREGGKEARKAATAALLDLGYADEAATALQSPSLSSRKRRATLTAILDDFEVGNRDTMMALLATFLAPPTSEYAEMLLPRMDRIVGHASPERRWRLRAAMKAGASIEQMEQLSRSLEGEAAAKTRQWVQELCHLTPQDRQRLDAARTPREIEDRLAQINLRRGRLVDGKYAVLAVVAMTPRREVPEEQRVAGKPALWSPPQRVSIEMPPLELRSIDWRRRETRDAARSKSKKDAEEPVGAGPKRVEELPIEGAYEVLWGDKVIGKGVAMEEPLPVRGPRAYFPTLRASPGWWDLAGFQPAGGEETENAEDVESTVPLRLPNQNVLWKPTPGTMTLEVSEYLKAGLRAMDAYPGHDLDDVIPSPLAVSMRYRLFGCYSGCGPDILPGFLPPDEKGRSLVREEKSDVHLLNVMFILEMLAPGERVED